MNKNDNHLHEAKKQNTMIRGLLVSSDKAIFQGIENQSMDWFLTSFLNQDYTVDNEMTDAVELLKSTMRATLDAQEALEKLIDNRIKKFND